MAADKDQLRTELARPPSRHAAADSEGLGFVRSGEHDPAADGDRLAAQGRVEKLLDRGVEGIEVGMEDRGCRFHPILLVQLRKLGKSSPRSEDSRYENIKRTPVGICQAADRLIFRCREVPPAAKARPEAPVRFDQTERSISSSTSMCFSVVLLAWHQYRLRAQGAGPSLRSIEKSVGLSGAIRPVRVPGSKFVRKAST